ncbi:hypothetical protein [Demequina mangrovi]|uniref:Uncharacterized protein n=1 Tax=Demequina mangrovi TaxID=1043493 RepID=A0A1H6WCY2_9MICO|nr:hypothetical protein [Demequina mangrovi]SEJ10412.1 hypothetical protein SAMN05421637_0784 [Demequina mangrovi]
MTRITKARAALAATSALALAAALAAPASADSDRRAYTTDYPVELFYDNQVTGGVEDYVAFVGWTAADFCEYPDNDSPVASMRVKPTGESGDRYALTTRVHAEVYEYTGGGVFDFQEEFCETGLPEPYATGTGVLRVRGTSAYEPGFTVGPEDWFIDAFDAPPPGQVDRSERNWFRGSLRAADGTRVQVATYAEVPTFYGMPAEVSIDVWGGR